MSEAQQTARVPFIPATPAQREEMLRVLGLSSTDELFAEIPEPLRFPPLDLEEGLSEYETLREIADLAGLNAGADQYRWFLGAGAYDHFIPAAVGALASRGEYLTAYTPYQPEVSQGTLQAMFEYQSMIAGLTGMDTVNAGHYDGASALAEAVIMALKNTGRRRVLLPSDLHPEYTQVLETYLAAGDVLLETYTCSPAEAAGPGRAGVAAGSAGAGGSRDSNKAEAGEDDLACLVAAYPGFSGIIPDLTGAAEAVHRRGGLFIVTADPVMLGLFKSPGSFGADIVTAEGQSLGNELNYGGPFLGIMAVKEELTRKIPGRIAGEARDQKGRRGFVLTLAAREQHIRREKAVSNICSNQGLITLRSCIYLSLLGKTGLRRVAELCWHKSHYAAKQLAALPGFSLSPGMFFKEFTITLPGDAEEAAEKLYQQNIVPGLPLSRYFPERARDLLVCVTEKNSRAQIDELVRALRNLYL